MTAAGARRARASPLVILIALAGGLAVAGVAVHSALNTMSGGASRELSRSIEGADLARVDIAGLSKIEARARRTLARSPLAPAPFVIAARIAQARDDRSRAIALMEQGRTRDPRNVTTRMWLTDRYLRVGRFGDAVGEIDALMRIRPAMRGPLVAVLVPLVGEADARPAIADALTGNPAWKPEFVDIARRDRRIADHFYGLMYTLGGRPGFALTDDEVSGIAYSALSNGDHRAAATLYGRFVQRSAGDPANRVFDGGFGGAPGPAPFNWTVSNAPSGYAQIEPSGGRGRLIVRTFGGAAAVLASQTLLIAPGQYIFATTGAFDGVSRVDGLVWRVVCYRTDAQIGLLPITLDAGQRFRHEARINVPPSCPVATIELAYAPIDRGAFGAMAFDSVSIAPAEVVQP